MTDDMNNWYSDETATFGDRVAAAREQAGLSQEALAKQLGIKNGTLRNWEHDLNEPRANKLQMLSGVLGVSLMWLLNGEGDGISAPDQEDLGGDINAVMTEIRAVKAQLLQAADRMAKLEKKLRAAAKGSA